MAIQIVKVKLSESRKIGMEEEWILNEEGRVRKKPNCSRILYSQLND